MKAQQQQQAARRISPFAEDGDAGEQQPRELLRSKPEEEVMDEIDKFELFYERYMEWMEEIYMGREEK